MTRLLHPTMRGPDGEPVEVIDVVLDRGRLQRREPSDPPAAAPPVRVVTLAEALERHQQAAGGVYPFPLPPDADVRAEASELARLEQEARQRPSTAELVERNLEAAADDLAERVADKLAQTMAPPRAVEPDRPPPRSRARSTGLSPAAAFGRAGAEARTKAMREEREAAIRKAAQLWPTARAGGLPFGPQQWTPMLAGTAIGALWPRTWPIRTQQTLAGYVKEAIAKGLMDLK